MLAEPTMVVLPETLHDAIMFATAALVFVLLSFLFQLFSGSATAADVRGTSHGRRARRGVDERGGGRSESRVDGQRRGFHAG